MSPRFTFTFVFALLLLGSACGLVLRQMPKPAVSSSLGLLSTRAAAGGRLKHSSLSLTLSTSFLPPPASLPSLQLFKAALLSNSVWYLILRNIKQQKILTQAGLFHAFLLGTGLWGTLNWQGWCVCVSYLVFGVAVTKVRMKEKEALGIAEKRGGARGPENLWGSAATGLMCAVGAWLVPSSSELLKIGYVSSLATKLSDTCGSEIGKAFGKTTYLITTLKRVPKGTEGAVSLEGTLAGIVGSFCMVASGIFFEQIAASPKAIASCVIAAFVATTAESFIGATFQDNVSWLTNELVNFINTLIGAAVGMALYALL